MRAVRNSSPEARVALESLCQSYWYPLYAFVRREGYTSHDAQDLTQAFFEQFLEKNFLRDVHRERGKFRSFLLASLKHFLANEWDRKQAQKRGGQAKVFSLDAQTAEERYRLEPSDAMSADKIYERRWALTLLDHSLAKLQREYEAAGKGDEFEQMKIFLSGDRSQFPYAELAPKLGLSEGALKVAVHRLRKRYREILRAEIAGTVSSASEVDGEIRYLFGVVGT
ncbi:MAG: hypothetical protein JWM16_3871 [Verrucomicrobiales bacterium]|nr:hypothetical protein [Verrucomicrobiales bacterium]